MGLLWGWLWGNGLLMVLFVGLLWGCYGAVGCLWGCCGAVGCLWGCLWGWLWGIGVLWGRL